MKRNTILVLLIALLTCWVVDVNAAGEWKRILRQNYSGPGATATLSSEVVYYYERYNNLSIEYNFQKKTRIDYVYDTSDRLKTKTTWLYDNDTRKWKGSCIGEYTYEKGKLKTYRLRNFNYAGELMEATSYYQYSYDTAGVLIKEERRNVSNDNIIEYTDYIYEEGRKTFGRTYSGGLMALNIEFAYSYNPDGTLAQMVKQVRSIDYEIPGDEGRLSYTDKETYTYTGGLLTEKIAYKYKSSDWEQLKKNNYSRDEAALTITEVESNAQYNKDTNVFEGWKEMGHSVDVHSDKLETGKAPGPLSATSTPEGVKLMWKSAMNPQATSYKIYRNYEYLATVDAGITLYKYTDPYVEVGVEYEYFVQTMCNSTEPMNINNIVKATAVQVTSDSIIVDKETVEFSAIVGKTDVKTILVSSYGLTGTLSACVMSEDSKIFTISSATLKPNTPNVSLQITFKPNFDGSFAERVAVYSGTDTVFVSLQGTGVAEGDVLPLDVSNPLASLNEPFSGLSNDKVFQKEGWKSLAVTGGRVWRGFNLKISGTGEGTAKATAYYAGEPGTPLHDMWLLTPALNFKTAASKMLTFRVLGEKLEDTQNTLLEVCLLNMKGATPDTIRLDVSMPSTPAENQEWKEYHLNLEGRDLADVFFVGFHFRDAGGRTKSAVYYIDDVSFGLTGLGSITPSKTSLEMEANVGVSKTSDAVQVNVQNLSAPVTLSLGGTDASVFTLSIAELPATGGSFTVSFLSSEVKTHQARIKVSSRGAADVYIPLSVKNTTLVSIEKITLTEDTDVSVFDSSGRQVLRKTICGEIDQLSSMLPDGIYIIHTCKGNFKLAVSKR